MDENLDKVVEYVDNADMSYDDVDVWAEQFTTRLTQAVNQPIIELPSPDAKFSDWRISYGIKSTDPNLYFLAFYPAFCVEPKLTFHTSKLSALANDVCAIMTFLDNVTHPIVDTKSITTRDLIACIFSILKEKDSIELFQEQKDLMENGLVHFHLDNAYQELIWAMCAEFYENGFLFGKPLTLPSIAGV